VYYEGATNDIGYNKNLFNQLFTALDPLGYKFIPYDITIPNAGDYINQPFVMHLYGPNTYEEEVFNSVVINNLQKIDSKWPIIIFRFN